MKWEDFFEVQYQAMYYGSADRHWRLVSKHEQFGCWPRYAERHHAIIAAKAKFRHMMKSMEKSLLGE